MASSQNWPRKLVGGVIALIGLAALAGPFLGRRPVPDFIAHAAEEPTATSQPQ
jgi:hypothetical protein